MKTLGQTCYEKFHEGFPWSKSWALLIPPEQERWERAAIAVAEDIVAAETSTILDIVEEMDLTPCPTPERMGNFACGDKTQCWEPCGELGHSEEHCRAYDPPEAVKAMTKAKLLPPQEQRVHNYD